MRSQRRHAPNTRGRATRPSDKQTPAKDQDQHAALVKFGAPPRTPGRRRGGGLRGEPGSRPAVTTSIARSRSASECRTRRRCTPCLTGTIRLRGCLRRARWESAVSTSVSRSSAPPTVLGSCRRSHWSRRPRMPFSSCTTRRGASEKRTARWAVGSTILTRSSAQRALSRRQRGRRRTPQRRRMP